MLVSHLRHGTFKTSNLSFPALSELHCHINNPTISSSSSSVPNPNPRNHASLVNLIERCKNIGELKQIHAKSIVSGLDHTRFVLNRIIRSSLDDSSLDYATRTFDQIHEPDNFIWNSMIRACSSSDSPFLAISIYNRMWASETTEPNNYTFPFFFRACSNYHASKKGKEAHGTIIRTGHDSDRFVRSSLLSFYASCGEMDAAERVFDESAERDVVFWNAMITCYARAGRITDAYKLFQEMQLANMRANEGTFLGLVSACVVAKDVGLGRRIHEYVVKEMDVGIGVKLGAALIDLYVKCGCIDDAQRLFEEMPEKNTVVWNSLICGYSKSGYPREAIKLFHKMHTLDVNVDEFTISGVLSACAQLGALNLGDWVRRFVEKKGIDDVFVRTALIDMYAKCGSIHTARAIFDQMGQRNIATWNAILSGYAMHGHTECTIDLYHKMERSGARPDSITFVSVLSACVHAGCVEEGRRYFNSMVDYYKIVPTVEHYGCMVDLLGRAGLLKEAEELVYKMEIEPNIVVWGALLSACSVHGHIEIGERVANHVFELDPTDGGSYVLLSNLYASARRFDGVKAVREMMAKRGVRKLPGCTMIEVGNVVHEFVATDKAHPRSKEIYLVLDELSSRMKMEGYLPELVIDQMED